MDGSLPMLLTFFVVIFVLYFASTSKSVTPQAKKLAELQHDKSRAEADRRRDLVVMLASNGNTILSQHEGFVQYKQPKSSFSILLFLILLLLGVLPGIIYILSYGTQKEKVSSVVLDI